MLQLNKRAWVLITGVAALVSGTSPMLEAEDLADSAATDEINAFSDCAGYYAYMSEVSRAMDETASAEFLRKLANGADAAALYLLAEDYSKKRGERRPYSDFQPYVAGRIEVQVAIFRASAEQRQDAKISQAGERCESLRPKQESLVQKIRNELYR